VAGGAANAGPSGKQASEYPEPDGLEAPPSIEKQVRPPSQRERAEVEFRQGMAALHAGNAAEAEDKLNAALAIDPLADNASQALLGLYIERGRREDAERLLEDRLRVDRKHAGFAMALGRLQLERGANGDALVTLQRSLPFGENSADYQAMTANALGRVGRHKESTERFEAATKLAPRNPVWLMGLGVELRADNRPAEARAAFQRARELGGLNPRLASFVDQQLRELK
jgi:MSHA biogenesis protein MshN